MSERKKWPREIRGRNAPTRHFCRASRAQIFLPCFFFCFTLDGLLLVVYKRLFSDFQGAILLHIHIHLRFKASSFPPSNGFNISGKLRSTRKRCLIMQGTDSCSTFYWIYSYQHIPEPVDSGKLFCSCKMSAQTHQPHCYFHEQGTICKLRTAKFTFCFPYTTKLLK